MSTEPGGKDPEWREQLRKKRVECLRLAWLTMMSAGIPDVTFGKFWLRPDLIGSIVDHYLNDYEIIRIRYKINGGHKIQLHRVAGLLTSAIMRYRPVCIKPKSLQFQADFPENENEVRINERYALLVGLTICAEKHQALGESPRDALMSNSHFARWFRDMMFFLETRNHTPESLIMVFESLCLSFFPKNFEET